MDVSGAAAQTVEKTCALLVTAVLKSESIRIEERASSGSIVATLMVNPGMASSTIASAVSVAVPFVYHSELIAVSEMGSASGIASSTPRATVRSTPIAALTESSSKGALMEIPTDGSVSEMEHVPIDTWCAAMRAVAVVPATTVEEASSNCTDIV